MGDWYFFGGIVVVCSSILFAVGVLYNEWKNDSKFLELHDNDTETESR